MSYLVLARKYRPRLFADMVGQEAVVQALSNALTQQRLHHAYLFTGTRGVGKTTVSRILAKSLNCLGADGQGGVTATPCGVCDACRDIDAGRFVDYTELDAASNRGVGEIQSLLEQAAYKPVQGRFKVFMIDEVHMLSNHAFNSMLKTLEEPPEYLKFVLATTDPQKVPVTVLSRCLQFNLRPMVPETVHRHLAQVLQAEQIGFDDDALAALSVAARGSMRDALSLADQAIAFGNGQLRGADVRQMLGLVGRNQVLDVLDALAVGDGAAVLHQVDALRHAGASAAAVLEDLCGVLHRMAVAQVVEAGHAPTALPGGLDVQRVTTLAQAMPADETQLLYSICLHGRAELALAPDEYAGLAMVLLRWLAFKPAPGAEAEKKSLNSAQGPADTAQSAPVSIANEGLAPAVAAPAAPTAAPTVSLAALPVRRAPSPEPAQHAGDALVPHSSPDNPRHNPQLAPAFVAAPPPQPGPVALKDARSPVSALPIVESPATARDEPASTADWEPTAEGEWWLQAVQRLTAAQRVSALTRELALQSQLLARDGDHWMLRVERSALNTPTTHERLTQALQAEGLAQRISVEVGRVSDTPARRLAALADAAQREAEARAHADPFVQRLMRDFGATIVPSSVRPS